jgi:uncharacterized protein (DUF433 family)
MHANEIGMDEQVLGIGAYTIPEAARLIGAKPALLKRWLNPSVLKANHKNNLPDALWQIQHYDKDDPLLGFRDLIEARIVKALRDVGISLQSIRLCIDRARDIVGDERPFSTNQFKTDGKSIFLQMTETLEDAVLIDLRRRQHVFHRIVAPSFTDLEFGDEAVIKWWPVHNKKSIVIDPKYSFGQPIISNHNITTRRIVELMRAEGSEARISKFYDISRKLISDAVMYEKSLDRA